MATRSSHSGLEQELDDFQSALESRDLDKFRRTTFDDLRWCIGDLQSRQHAERQLQDLTRLERFLEVVGPFGKSIQAVSDRDDVLPFIWGPSKFLLEETSKHVGAFNEILTMYKDLGESLPRLPQWEDFTTSQPHIIEVLVQIYKQMLEFHFIMLNYFRQPQWQQHFEETWKIIESELSGKIQRIAQSRSLIESEASPSQIEDFQRGAEQSRQELDNQLREEDLRRLEIVYRWLKASDVDTDQHDLSELRAEYPQSGRWLFENRHFSDWFDPLYPAVPPLLWLNGRPGAGKTVLSSLVVEEARRLDPSPTVLFFYCKQDDPERGSFLDIARTLLKQLLQQNKGLLATFYPRCCRSGETTLTSPDLTKELLHIAFEKCKKAYIILDGIDECPRDQRKIISDWFRKLVEDLPTSEPERIRCLFVSQEDGIARKDFAGLTSVRIGGNDNKEDIKTYNKVEADKLRESFRFSEQMALDIAARVTNSAEGIFLLAKLTWANLSAQTSMGRLEEELQPAVFPNGIDAAYERIMSRIARDSTPQAMSDIRMFLGWLVCAKRSLKWHEIQGMKSIDLDGRSVMYEQWRFSKGPKDLCGSLVEVKSDGTVELIHLSVKLFLIDAGHIDLVQEELKLACLCIDYLNLPAFVGQPNLARVLNGEYAFMDYAVIYWLRHVEAGVTLYKTDTSDVTADEPLMRNLQESLEVFVEQHWTAPRTRLTLAKRHSDKLQSFRSSHLYHQIEQAVASTRQQLKQFTAREQCALDLGDVVEKVRRVLEQTWYNSTTDAGTQQQFKEKYGDDFFKCPRFSCQFFRAGFPTAEKRNRHTDRHNRPFRCADESCTGYLFGFMSAAERDKHIRDSHSVHHAVDDEFPTDYDVQRSINSGAAPSNGNAGEASDDDESTHEDRSNDVQDPESQDSSDSEVRGTSRPAKRRVPEKFVCVHCQRVFGKRYNLTSHLKTHDGQREHMCTVCEQDFARRSDLTRHLKTKHAGDKKFACRGQLRDGTPWGCGKSFSRADILSNHYKSRVGSECIRAFQREQEEQEQRLGGEHT